MGVLRII